MNEGKKSKKFRRAATVAVCMLLCAVICAGAGACFTETIAADRITVENSGGEDIAPDGGQEQDPAEGGEDGTEYSPEIAAAAETLFAAVDGAVKAAFGETLSSSQKDRVRKAMQSIIGACEKRAIAEADMLSAVDAVAGGEEALAIALKGFAGGGNSVENITAVQSIFGEIAALFGVELAGRLVYDLVLIYCDGEIEKYTEMYSEPATHIPGVLLRIEEWKSRKENLTAFAGEDNFALFARILYSGSGFLTAALSGDADALFGQDGANLSDGEAAAALRAEGKLLSGLSLGKEGWSAIAELFASSGAGGLAAAMTAGERTELCGELPAAVKALSVALSAAENESVALLRGGDKSAFLHSLFSVWESGQWEAFDRLWSVSVSDETYETYFRREKLLDDYKNYVSDMDTCGLEELRAADADGFYDALKAYCNGKSPQAAFLIFDERDN